MNAKWIWIDMAMVRQPRMIYFKKNIFIPDRVPGKCRVRVSADSRYILYVNGQRVMTGPCRSVRGVRYADEADIAGLLHTGDNEIFVKAVQYTDNKYENMRFMTGPTSIVTEGIGGLYIEEKDTFYGIGTSKEYKCVHAEGYGFPQDNIEGYVGFMERVDAVRACEDMPESAWKNAEEFSFSPEDTGTLRNFWMLEPRPIPLMYERRDTFKRITEGAVSAVEPGESAYMMLDAGRLVNAYPRIDFTCAEGSRLKIIYAEGFGTMNESGTVTRGVRDKAEGQSVYGHADEYIAKEGRQTYIPFLYRSFRVVKIEIENTGKRAEPFVIHSVDYISTGYPLKIEGSFTSDNKTYEKLWKISVRTLKRCMYETYMDCPYYEQMQYAMDTFLEVRYTLAVSSDHRLARKAINDFAQAQLRDGMIPCNSPSKFMQIIPGFPFYWVLMLDTYMMYTGDTEFVRSHLGTLDKLFCYYRCRINEKGILGNTGYWQFFDWVKEWHNGSPVTGNEDNILYSMLYVCALRAASGINRFCGRNDTALEYEKDADGISQAIIKNAYDADSGMFSDVPGKSASSMHAQIFAVLSGTVTGSDAKALMSRMIENRGSLSQPSYCMTYFLCRALEMTGLYNEIHTSFEIWNAFIKLSHELHLSTWPEDFIQMRSDCHGWSSVILYEFAACYLGVRPTKPGCSEITVRPLPCPLKKYGGSVPIGDKGVVTVEIETDERGKHTVNVHVPDGVKCICDFSQLDV